MKIKIIYTVILLSFLCGKIKAEDKFLSLKKNTVNVRYCPEFKCPVKYTYKKINLPVKIIDKKENFRKIIDLKKNSGWIHISQLKQPISFIILENKILLKKPSLFSRPIIRLEKGRLLVVKKCQSEWCYVKTGSYKGWVKTDKIWGDVN
ncbi:SH3 domain-containing protein [Candidatus Pelagibacter sp.]|nr:SH3 domain-containing protein [Candidatus Pelagibacter sp.]